MEPVTIIFILFLVLIVGGSISLFQASKKTAGSPTHQLIDRLEKEDYPEFTHKYKLEDLENIRALWSNNGVKISDTQFQELYDISTQDDKGNFTISNRSMELSLEFHGREKHVYIIIESFYNLGNIIHIYSKDQELLDSFKNAFQQAR